MPSFIDHEFRPVILGADITAYSLVRTFYEAYGVKSLVVNMSDTPVIGYSELSEHVMVPNFHDLEVFRTALVEVGEKYGKAAGKKLLILGCGDWYVRMLVENKELLAPYFEIPYIDLDLLDQLVLKDQFYAILDRLDIPYPRTVVYDCTTRELPEFDFTYPIVAKPASSALYHYAEFPGKKKVFILDSREELMTMLDNLATSSYDYKFLIQEFIPGDDTNMRVLTCYSDRDAKVRFGSVGQTLLEEHVPSAIGNPCAIISTSEDQLVHQAQRFLEDVGYTGFSNFDIKYDPRDGSFRFFEINVRLGRSNYYVTGAGHNVAEWMVRDLIRHEPMDGLVISRAEHLFTFVPKYVIKTFVRDRALRDKALALFAAGRWSDPQLYRPDLSLKRRAYLAAYGLNQVKKFYRYLGRPS
ncbi:MAG TPA: carboxylate--amine ligase [Dermatophilaceae bacterium]|nr:carboxylate--amine ligase [Dermatophilaceae bacterium]